MLRAKGPDSRGEELSEHVFECLRMLDVLRDCGFVERLHYVMGLEKFHNVEALYTDAKLAVQFHDMGKAGTDFQKYIWSLDKPFDQRPKQRVRHELVSYWLSANHPAISSYLSAHASDVENVQWAIYGHHVKTNREIEDGSSREPPVRVGLSQFDWAKVGLPPLCTTDVMVPFKDLVRIKADTAFETRPETPYSIALKWLVILADSLGSMTPTNYADLDVYVEGLIQFVQDLCRTPKLYDYESCITDRATKTPHPFQVEAKANRGRSVLLEVGCGRGKTDAAYMWARPDLRLVFNTPTTGTATQIYKDHENQDSALLHSRVCVDLTNAHYSKYLDGLPDYDHPITYCTVDQVLSSLACKRSSILWLPYIVHSQIVFDEFHDYDAKLAEFFHRFREWFPNLPFLVMSASGSEAKRKALGSLVRIQDDTGPSSPASWPRYEVKLVSEVKGVPRDRKVLWIVNTVKQAVELAQKLRASCPGARVLVYHSRFKYLDRVERHKQFVQAFRDAEPVIGIATQVAEMSLDISADYMLSEVAPIESMIQRMGRLNRYMKQTDTPKTCIFYLPNGPRPYEEGEFKLTGTKLELTTGFQRWSDWLKKLPPVVSQNDLSALLNQFDQQFPAYTKSYEFSAGVHTSWTAIREEDGGVLAVLNTDLVKIDPDWEANGGRRISKVQLKGLEIPTHIKPQAQKNLARSGQVVQHRFVLDGSLYSSDYGLV